MDFKESQIREALSLQDQITRTTADLEAAMSRAAQANETLREVEDTLKAAENDVTVQAVIMKDERLPSAVSSKAYGPALDSIVREARENDLADLVKERNQIKEHASVCTQELEALRVRLSAQKAQAQLQAAILDTLPRHVLIQQTRATHTATFTPVRSSVPQRSKTPLRTSYRPHGGRHN